MKHPPHRVTREKRQRLTPGPVHIRQLHHRDRRYLAGGGSLAAGAIALGAGTAVVIRRMR